MNSQEVPNLVECKRRSGARISRHWLVLMLFVFGAAAVVLIASSLL